MARLYIPVSSRATDSPSLTELYLRAFLVRNSYVRMLASPALYNVGADYMEGDPALLQKRCKSSLRMSHL